VKAGRLQARIARDQGQIVGDAMLGFAQPVVGPDMANGRIAELSAFNVHGSGGFRQGGRTSRRAIQTQNQQKIDSLF
jgi:hypothetical protein